MGLYKMYFIFSFRTIKGRAKGTGDNHPAKDGVNSDTKKNEIPNILTHYYKSNFLKKRDY